mmetsp:Transcript_40121/g.87633  ORF Transcript_40121/g.87633 Transcript_40121/m.87633 type:complete len:439 (+) Transcript_40121:58-1374(+)
MVCNSASSAELHPSSQALSDDDWGADWPGQLPTQSKRSETCSTASGPMDTSIATEGSDDDWGPDWPAKLPMGSAARGPRRMSISEECSDGDGGSECRGERDTARDTARGTASADGTASAGEVASMSASCSDNEEGLHGHGRRTTDSQLDDLEERQLPMWERQWREAAGLPAQLRLQGARDIEAVDETASIEEQIFLADSGKLWALARLRHALWRLRKAPLSVAVETPEADAVETLHSSPEQKPCAADATPLSSARPLGMRWLQRRGRLGVPWGELWSGDAMDQKAGCPTAPDAAGRRTAPDSSVCQAAPDSSVCQAAPDSAKMDVVSLVKPRRSVAKVAAEADLLPSVRLPRGSVSRIAPRSPDVRAPRVKRLSKSRHVRAVGTRRGVARALVEASASRADAAESAVVGLELCGQTVHITAGLNMQESSFRITMNIHA